MSTAKREASSDPIYFDHPSIKRPRQEAPPEHDPSNEPNDTQFLKHLHSELSQSPMKFLLTNPEKRYYIHGLSLLISTTFEILPIFPQLLTTTMQKLLTKIPNTIGNMLDQVRRLEEEDLERLKAMYTCFLDSNQYEPSLDWKSLFDLRKFIFFMWRLNISNVL
jgi:hypothetical protein